MSMPESQPPREALPRTITKPQRPGIDPALQRRLETAFVYIAIGFGLVLLAGAAALVAWLWLSITG